MYLIFVENISGRSAISRLTGFCDYWFQYLCLTASCQFKGALLKYAVAQRRISALNDPLFSGQPALSLIGHSNETTSKLS